MLMPLSIILLLLFIAILFYRLKPKLSFSSLLLASALLFFSSFAPLSDTLMTPLEDNYPAFTKSEKPIDYIIILGGAHRSAKGLPATSQLKSSSLARLVEAVRIYHLHPEAQIITSGYASDDESSNAEKVKQAAIILGIPKHKILTENFPQDTEEEAQLIAPRVLNRNVVLVTSASHLPRAMAYFKKYGVNAIPAPASPSVKDNGQKAWSYYLPHVTKLQQTTGAWYEALGRIVPCASSLL